MINNNYAENKIENGFLIMKAAFLSYQYSCNMIENYNKNDDLKKFLKMKLFTRYNCLIYEEKTKV